MPRFSITASTTILIFLSTCFIACSGTRGLASRSGAEQLEHRVRGGDIIEIAFDYYPDFNQTAVVTPQGKIRLKELDEFAVAGLTSFELKERLAKKYARVLAAPVIQLNIYEASRFTLYVGGDLNKPGLVRFKENLTITSGILLAGGLREKLDSYKIFVFRNHSGGVRMYKFILDESWRKDKAKRNFKLAPYDVVFVVKPKAGIKKAKRAI